MGNHKLVLIGNGMAGVRCIEHILKEGTAAFDITIFGSEPHGNYNRIMLSSILQGNTTYEEIMLNPINWYEENGIHLFTGESVIFIDKEKKIIETDKGRKVPYDKLIIATGSSPAILPLNGADKEGVISFRTIEDCRRMTKAAKLYKKAVVIGGGVLGLEAARGLLNLGMEVHVVHRSKYIMQRQLDETASIMLQKELEGQGIHFLLNKDSEEILGDARVEKLRFKDGTEIATDLVVMAVGIKPNIQLAKSSGIKTNRGIVVDGYLATNSCDIYALGECAEHEGMTYGLVKPLYEQGEVLARHLCNDPTNPYQGSVLSTQLKISGVDVFSVGQFIPDDTTQGIYYQNEIEGVYKKVFFQGSKAVGAVLFGDTREGPKLLDMIVKEKVIADKDKASLLEAVNPAKSHVANLPITEHVCTCNAVSKEVIIKAVQENNLKTVEEVRRCTKASGSCGGCKPSVAELLTYIHSDDFNEEVKVASLCSCTSLIEDEVIEEIQLKALGSLEEIMDQLNWSTEKGCSKCRAALLYYLEMIYPWFENSEETLYVNDRMNATLQSNGTYTIVPQIHGGRPDIDQMKKITYVAEKYPSIELVVAGDQRIQLSGVKKEELNNVWVDLDMPLYARGFNKVAPIQTSAGVYLCNCIDYSYLDLVTGLEQKTALLKTPFRITIGISFCFHDGADATLKDLGAIRVSGRWEIYVGGSVGKDVRQGRLLSVVETDEEAQEFMLSFIQYYRESSHYLERSWQWIERAGLVHIREVLFNDEIRTELLVRMDKDRTQRNRSLVKI
ncbi:nitrite reductase (NADH) large subunit [Thalassobacillus cyri]|uniref:Nitrite reductase (NADH) large subunit n=1 Tax=Thalassobacillus cyri TaxID=571932 RepID=A0A1H4F4F3_9BACI|nr:nitrite reductase large subunit NirB [Thalassobacillus cyri]SEA92129.1 nitrite reductase (NADH) large subunit [Thalassobacillus cyri]